uniref:Translation initiation factor eIF2B subunit delta n=1 Tax=Phlebotomus papatasi TaxID=29031 RepID=A0A1B0DJN3_PHLPP
MEKEKTREEILQERKNKKLEKKTKVQPKEVQPKLAKPEEKPAEKESTKEKAEVEQKPSREDILAQREAKKLAKQNAKQKTAKTEPTEALPAIQKSNTETELAQKLEQLTISDPPKAKATTKAERRALQEAQRAAKEQKMKEKTAKDKPAPTKTPTVKKETLKVSPATKKSPRSDGVSTSQKHRVKLFSHLYLDHFTHPPKVSGDFEIHQAIRTLGAQYSKMEITGANARCFALLTIMKIVIKKFKTPPEKEFSRCLETYVGHIMEYLEQCRPMAVSMTNAMKYLKWQITQLPTDIVHTPDPDSEEEDDPHIEKR